ncbi:MAG: hypothetical protein ABEL76_05900 [Bradymonadaceae bacterium]
MQTELVDELESDASERKGGGTRLGDVARTATELIDLLEERTPEEIRDDSESVRPSLDLLREVTERASSIRRAARDLYDGYVEHGVGGRSGPDTQGQRETHEAAELLAHLVAESIDDLIAVVVDRLMTDRPSRSAAQHRRISEKVDELVQQLLDLWLDLTSDESPSI